MGIGGLYSIYCFFNGDEGLFEALILAYILKQKSSSEMRRAFFMN